MFYCYVYNFFYPAGTLSRLGSSSKDSLKVQKWSWRTLTNIGELGDAYNQAFPKYFIAWENLKMHNSSIKRISDAFKNNIKSMQL